MTPRHLDLAIPPCASCGEPTSAHLPHCTTAHHETWCPDCDGPMATVEEVEGGASVCACPPKRRALSLDINECGACGGPFIWSGVAGRFVCDVDTGHDLKAERRDPPAGRSHRHEPEVGPLERDRQLATAINWLAVHAAAKEPCR